MFSSNESEEVERLKKLLARDALYLSQLQQAKTNTDAELDELRNANKALQTSVDKAAARLHEVEELERQAREDRDRRALANANLEQALAQSKEQLTQREKDRRLAERTTDAAVGVRERELLAEREQLEKRCTTLESQLREAQTTNVYGSSGAVASSSRLTSLEQENTQLKLDLDRLRSSTASSSLAPSHDSPGGRSVQSRRSRRSSGINVTGSEEQQLREINSELSDQIEKVEARATRAEREALKASNERLASERRCQTTIDTLKAERDEAKDELKHCNLHADAMERQLDAITGLLRAHEGRADDIEKDVRDLLAKSRDADDARAVLQAVVPAPRKQGRNSSESSGESLSDVANKASKAFSESQSQQQKTSRSLGALQEEAQQMRAQLYTLDQTTQTLSLRERELSAAKRRLKKLSTVLRKALPSAAGLLGDASMMTVGGVGEETMAGDVTLGVRGFEADMVDELEQLLTYVEELDGKLEFQRVEHEIQESNAVKRCDKLQQKVGQLEEAFAEADGAGKSLRDEVKVLQGRVQRRTEQIGRHQQELKQEQMNRKLAEDALRQFVASHEADETMLSDHEEETKLKQELANKERELGAAEERILDLQMSMQQLERELEGRMQTCETLEQAQKDMAEKVQQLYAAGERLAEHGSAAQHLERELAQHLKHELGTSVQLLSEVSERVAGFEASTQQLEQELAAKAQQLRQADERVADLEASTQQLVRAHAIKEHEGEELVQLKQEFASKVQELKEAGERVAELEGDVKHAEQALASRTHSLEDAEERAAGLEHSLQQLEQHHTQESDVVVQLKGELARSDQALCEECERVTSLDSAVQRLEQEQARSKEDLERQRLELVAQSEQVERQRSELADKSQQLVAAEERVADLENATQQQEEEGEDAKAQLAALQAKTTAKAQQYDEAMQRVVDLEIALVEVQQELAEKTTAHGIASQRLVELKGELDAAKAQSALQAGRHSGEAAAAVEQLRVDLAAKEQSLREAEERVADLESATQQLEVELSMKAQECEDADDKELALRKDNKRLAGRVAAMQARLDKLQSAATAAPLARTIEQRASVAQRQAAIVAPQTSPNHSPVAKLVPTRKRRSPDEDDGSAVKQEAGSRGSSISSSSSLDRACVYAPGPTALTTASPAAAAQELPDPHPTPVESNSLQNSLSRSGGGGGGGGAKPSDLVAMRLQQKLAAGKVVVGGGGGGVIRFADRTNKPRDGSSDPATAMIKTAASKAGAVAATGDSHFMAKLSRYRTPAATAPTTAARKVHQ